MALACLRPDVGRAQEASELKSVEKDLAQSRAEREKAVTDAAKISRELNAARAAEVALAKDIQDQEYSLTLLENRIAELETEASKRTAALSLRDAQMRTSLMALERLALHPADALSLSPLAPDDAVRAAILLRAAVPAITTSAQGLQQELADLYQLRAQIVAQKEQVATGAAALLDKRRQLTSAIAAKTAQQTQISAHSQELDDRVGRLSRQAEDLRALFAKLAEEKAARDAEAHKAAEAAAAHARTKPSSAQDHVVLKPPPGVPPESGPERLFSQAKGTLPYPAVGKITAQYGETPPGAAAGGVMAKGLTIATRPGATVVSPFDGTVVFAGPFRGYGELLIIEHTEGYHTLLAGLGRIDGTLGQRVLAGEPVGSMSDDASPALYVELRRDGQPINPLPWLASRRGDQQTNSVPTRRESRSPG
jgi:septal ring factor EnvC (AmiA/AmiB activator)